MPDAACHTQFRLDTASSTLTRRALLSRGVCARVGSVDVGKLNSGGDEKTNQYQLEISSVFSDPPLPKAGKSGAPTSWESPRELTIQNGNGWGTRRKLRNHRWKLELYRREHIPSLRKSRWGRVVGERAPGSSQLLAAVWTVHVTSVDDWNISRPVEPVDR